MPIACSLDSSLWTHCTFQRLDSYILFVSCWQVSISGARTPGLNMPVHPSEKKLQGKLYLPRRIGLGCDHAEFPRGQHLVGSTEDHLIE